MKDNKRTDLKRLVIFLLLAFGLAWVPWIIMNKVYGFEEWFNNNKAPILANFSMYAPALANVLTRLITKEGWSDSKLHLRLKGHVRYYVFAMLMPYITGILGAILLTAVYGKFDLAELRDKLDMSFWAVMLLIAAQAAAAAFITFGEEFGWRAYMNQKMERLIGVPGTVIVGGILWGVWHAPLTVEGHNFGTDYAGYPWLGILIMCLFCTTTGAFLMWLTRKTDSVYPAALWHACNNFGGSAIAVILALGVGEDFDPGITGLPIITIPYIVLAVICTLLMVRAKRRGA